MSETSRVKWACPKCGATPDKCGGKCGGRPGGCSGFLCDCTGETSEDHGETYENPCPEANCYCCWWGGTFPAPKRKPTDWEAKALAAGWQPPKGWQA